MKRYFTRLALALSLLSSLPSASAPAADLLWGVNGHPLIAYQDVSFAEQLDVMRQLGLTSYRVNISEIGHLPKLADLVREAKARKIEILPVITPAIDLDASSPEDIYARTYKLAYDLVRHFKADIRTWELGNEMENYAILKPCERYDDGSQYNCSWGPAGGVGANEYFTPRWRKVSAALKGLADGTIAVDPTIRKAMGTAGWGHLGAFERMQADGIRWDISVWHFYGEDPEWAFQNLARYGKPIWVTEFNNPYGSQNGEGQQADGLRHAIARLRYLSESYNVEAAHVYELIDETYWAPDFEAVMGLVRLEKNAAGKWTIAGPKLAHHLVREVLAPQHHQKDRALGAKPLNKLGGLPAAGQAAGAQVAAVDPNKATPVNLKADTAGSGSGQCDPAVMIAKAGASFDKIQYIYCLTVGRPADGGGYQSWSANLKSGMSNADMLQAMLESDEFQRRFNVAKLSDTDFVTLMFRVLLKRDPDGAGLTGYAQGLGAKTLTRAALARALLESGEFRTRHSALFN